MHGNINYTLDNTEAAFNTFDDCAIGILIEQSNLTMSSNALTSTPIGNKRDCIVISPLENTAKISKMETESTSTENSTNSDPESDTSSEGDLVLENMTGEDASLNLMSGELFW